MRSWSGPMPDNGSSAPPSTWYRPLNSRVRSIDRTSLGSSTTQTELWSRRASRQIRQRVSSETLPHRSQKTTPSLTFCSAAISRPVSTGSAPSRWKAIRWALFGPTPGSRPSSSIRSWTGPSYISRLQPGQPEAGEPAGQRAHLVAGELLRVGRGVPDRGDDQVGEGLGVLGVDHLGVDGERLQFAGAGHGRGDRPAARAAGHLGVGQLFLGGQELLLHFLRLRHDLL